MFFAAANCPICAFSSKFLGPRYEGMSLILSFVVKITAGYLILRHAETEWSDLQNWVDKLFVSN